MEIALLEDSLQDLGLLRSLVERYLVARNLQATIRTFQTAEAFQQTIEPGKYRVAMFDCYLDEAKLARGESAQTGLDAARALRAQDSNCAIVFATSSRDFAVESYEVQAAGYLIKPVSYVKLASLLDKLGLAAPAANKVTLGGKAFDAGSFIWAQSKGHYLDLHLTGGKTLNVRASFSMAQAALGDPRQFYSPARGFLVNLDMVERIDEEGFVLRGGETVPISRRTRSDARAAWSTWVSLTFGMSGDDLASGGV